MNPCAAVVEQRPDTGLQVGHVPRFPGTHRQGDEEWRANLRNVVALVRQEVEHQGRRLASSP